MLVVSVMVVAVICVSPYHLADAVLVPMACSFHTLDKSAHIHHVSTGPVERSTGPVLSCLLGGHF